MSSRNVLRVGLATLVSIQEVHDSSNAYKFDAGYTGIVPKIVVDAALKTIKNRSYWVLAFDARISLRYI